MVKHFCSFEILFGKLHAGRRDPAWLQSTERSLSTGAAPPVDSLVGDLLTEILLNALFIASSLESEHGAWRFFSEEFIKLLELTVPSGVY